VERGEDRRRLRGFEIEEGTSIKNEGLGGAGDTGGERCEARVGCERGRRAEGRARGLAGGFEFGIFEVGFDV